MTSRAELWRGVVPVSAWLFNPSSRGEAEARRRVLAGWCPGAELFRLSGGRLLLRLPAPVTVACERAPGLPLVRQADLPKAAEKVSGELLLGVRLSDQELAALRESEGVVAAPQLVFLEAGVLRLESLVSAEREDPARWLDLAAWTVSRGESLGTPPPPPVLVAPSLPEDLRQLMAGKVPPASAAAHAFLAGLRAPGAQATGGAAGRAFKSLGQWWRSLRETLRPRGAAGEPGRAAAPGRADPTAAPAPPRGFAALWRRLRDRLLFLSRLSRVLSRRQAEYLWKTLEMFDRGNLEEALKHAIPLATFGPPQPPAWSLPSARSTLSIRPAGTAATTSLAVGGDFHTQLQRTYRAAFERLKERGEIDQAAFVLAELLGVTLEAVSFLEQHGRLRLAAEIAEARGLPADVVVRQWFLAGEVERAVRVARRHQAFSLAVHRLESQRHSQAASLRLLWAESLAAAGDFRGAVEAARPAPEAEGLARSWLELGLAQGGAEAAALRVHQVELEPASAPAVAAEVRRLLADPSAERDSERVMLLRTLVSRPPSREIALLARLMARALVAGSWMGSENETMLRKVLALAADPVLDEDVSRLPPRPDIKPGSGEGLAAKAWPLLTLAREDRGSTRIWDAAFLPGGRLLVAMGEAGVWLLSREGRRSAFFDQPAERLVVADHGGLALALSLRDQSWRIARLDLATRRSKVWAEARLNVFAPTYDGGLWFAALDDRLMLIDTRADRFEMLWHLPELPGRVLALDRSRDWCSVVVAGGPASQVWRLSLPALTLRAREDIPWLQGHDLLAVAVGADGVLGWVEAGSEEDSSAVERVPAELVLRRQEREIGRWPLPEEPVRLWLAGENALLARRGAESFELQRFVPGQPHPQAVARWGGDKAPSLRHADGFFTLADDQGRVVVLEAASGRVVRNLRL